MIAVRLLAADAVVRELVVRDGTLLIGRGPENDFVLADLSVSRRHARVRIDESGMAWIEDAGGRHGVRVGGSAVDSLAVPAGTSVRCHLGSVELELAAVSPDATLELPAWDASAVRASAPRRAVAGFVYWLANVAGTAALLAASPPFWSPWEQGRASKMAWVCLTAAVVVLVFAFVLVGLLRVLGRRVRPTEALRAFALVAWAWVVATFVEQALSYGLSVSAHALASGLLAGVMGAASIAYLASISRPGPRRRFFFAWLAAAGLFIAALQAVVQLAARQAGMPDVAYDVLPPVAGVTGPAAELDPYLEDVRATFETAARRAAEERGRSPVD